MQQNKHTNQASGATPQELIVASADGVSANRANTPILSSEDLGAHVT